MGLISRRSLTKEYLYKKELLLKAVSGLVNNAAHLSEGGLFPDAPKQLQSRHCVGFLIKLE